MPAQHFEDCYKIVKCCHGCDALAVTKWLLESMILPTPS